MEHERLSRARSAQVSHLDQLHEVILSIHRQLAGLSSLSLPGDTAAVDTEREGNIAYFDSKALWKECDQERLGHSLFTVFDTLRIASTLLHPILPRASRTTPS